MLDTKKKTLFSFGLLLCLSLVYLFTLSKNSIYRYEIFEQEGDLAAYENAIYHSAQGKLFHTTVAGSVMKYWTTRGTKKPPYPMVPKNFSLLGIHFMPTLLVTNVIFYKIFPSTYTTLILQTLSIVLSALLLFWLGRELKIPVWLCTLASISFLYHPASIGANLNAFHPIVMILPFTIAAVWAITKGWWKTYAILFLLIAGAKESAPLILIGLSLYIYFQHGKKKALINLFTSVFVFFLITKALIPFFNEDGSLPYGSVYGSPLGNSMGRIMINSILKPFLFLQTVFSATKVAWMANLMLPLMFLMLFSPSGIVLVGLALAPNLVSQNPTMTIFWGQYNSLAMPFIFIGSYWGFQNLMRIYKTRLEQKISKQSIKKIIPYIFAASCCLCSYIAITKVHKSLQHVSLKHVLHVAFTKKWDAKEKAKDYNQVLELIPKEATLSAPDTFLTKSHARSESYIYPVHKELVDYVVYKKKSPWIKPNQQAIYTKELLDAGYAQIFENDLLVLMKKGKE